MVAIKAASAAALVEVSGAVGEEWEDFQGQGMEGAAPLRDAAA
jgi:hypothetical protein